MKNEQVAVATDDTTFNQRDVAPVSTALPEGHVTVMPGSCGNHLFELTVGFLKRTKEIPL